MGNNRLLDGASRGNLAKACQSPLPADLDSAKAEILRLRMQLITQNERMASQALKFELDKRALKGLLDQLRAENAALKASQGPSR